MKYTTMLPFMDNEELKELAFQVINEEVKGERDICSSGSALDSHKWWYT